MAGDVKPRRRYDSGLRRAQADATRAAILDGARRAFERDGYAATSVQDVASAAGVSLKTVYLAFGTKAGVLRALWHRLLRGDDDPVPVGERDWYREVLEEPDPRRQLALNARNSRRVKERAGALLRVVREAAAVDADAAELWQRIETEFHANQRAVVASLAQKKALRRGLSVGRGADVLWAVNHPSIWWLLVGERGWSGRQYESWLADASSSQLLREKPR